MDWKKDWERATVNGHYTSPILEFEQDHPFFFLFQDKTTKIIHMKSKKDKPSSKFVNQHATPSNRLPYITLLTSLMMPYLKYKLIMASQNIKQICAYDIQRHNKIMYGTDFEWKSKVSPQDSRIFCFLARRLITNLQGYCQDHVHKLLKQIQQEVNKKKTKKIEI